MRVRVATLNAWGLPILAADVGPRLRAIGRELEALDLDVVAFQEVWTPVGQRALIEAGRRAGLVHHWHRRRLLLGSGLLVLSRLPVEEVDFDRFALRADAGSRKDELLGGKGFAEVRVRTPAGPLRVIDTHLHAGRSGADGVANRTHRTAQIVQLCREVRELRDPVLVLGDLNCSARDPEHGVLTGLSGLRDVAAERGWDEPTVTGENPYRASSSHSDRRIDFVLARDGVDRVLHTRTVEHAFDRPLFLSGRRIAFSNHRGVLAELSLEPAAGSANVPAPPDPRALAVAHELLSQGARAARSERRRARKLAGFGLAGALLAAGSRRALHPTRRQLLRGGLHLSAGAALAPGLGMSLLSEWFLPVEIDGFGEARADLARIEQAGRSQAVARARAVDAVDESSRRG